MILVVRDIDTEEQFGGKQVPGLDLRGRPPEALVALDRRVGLSPLDEVTNLRGLGFAETYVYTAAMA